MPFFPSLPAVDPNDIEDQAALEQENQRRAEAMGEFNRIQQLAPRPEPQLEQQPQAEQSGLNDQGQGAAFMPMSAPSAPGFNRAFAPLIPRADRQVVANPLTGILEAAPNQHPVSPQNDPWVAQQVQNLERSMDLLQQNQTLSPFQMQHALARKQQQLQQVDPQGIYRRGSVNSQLTKFQQWQGQNSGWVTHPVTGQSFFVALDGRGTPHYHEPKVEKAQAQISPPDWTGFHHHGAGIYEHPNLPGRLWTTDQHGIPKPLNDPQGIAEKKIASAEGLAEKKRQDAKDASTQKMSVAAEKMLHDQDTGWIKHIAALKKDERKALVEELWTGKAAGKPQPELTPEQEDEVNARVERRFPVEWRHYKAAKERMDAREQERDQTGGTMGRAHAGLGGQPLVAPLPPKELPTVEPAQIPQNAPPGPPSTLRDSDYRTRASFFVR